MISICHWGRLRCRAKGSSGGQKGLQDIIRCLGTEQVSRLRVGIGAPPDGWDVADYVLSKFTSEELPLVQQAIDQGCGRRCRLGPPRDSSLHESIQRRLDFTRIDSSRPSYRAQQGDTILASNVYECMFILDPNRYSRDPDGICRSDSGQMIEESGGEVLASRLWNEQRLAYPIGAAQRRVLADLFPHGNGEGRRIQSRLPAQRQRAAEPDAAGRSSLGRHARGPCPRRSSSRNRKLSNRFAPNGLLEMLTTVATTMRRTTLSHARCRGARRSTSMIADSRSGSRDLLLRGRSGVLARGRREQRSIRDAERV